MAPGFALSVASWGGCGHPSSLTSNAPSPKPAIAGRSRRMTRVVRVLVALVVTLALTAKAAAQMDRRAFVGTVVDCDGIPVPNLEVHCDWLPNASQLGRPDRARAKTDLGGEFSIDLLVGRSYCVWACGQSTRGTRFWAIEPQFTGLAGGRAAIVATEVGTPGSVRIRGLAAWREYQPLSLRVWGSRSSVICDIGLKEDRFYELPPVPSKDLVFDLVAADGQTLMRSPLHLDRNREFNVGNTVQLRVEVVDQAGNYLPGAVVLERIYSAHDFAPPLTSGLPGLASIRAIATTDDAGRATGRIRRPDDGDPTLIFAERGDSSSPYSGWMGKQAFGGARGNAGGASLDVRLTLVRGESTEVRLEGWPDERGLFAVLHASQASEASETLSGRFLHMSDVQPISVGLVRTRTLAGEGSQWRIAGCWDGGDGGPRAISWIFPREARAQVVNFASARELRVKVVDEVGNPSPFATIGLSKAHGQVDAEIAWDAVVVASSKGEARVLSVAGDGYIYAVGENAHGLARIQAADKGVRVSTRPYVQHMVRVVDLKGEPIAGAALHVFLDPDSDRRSLLAHCAMEGRPDPFRGKVTDKRGTCSTSIPPELIESGSLAVVFDGKTYYVGSLSKDPIVIPR